MYPELKIPACPDRQIISLFLDGELPSPWKEKMETHLESCPNCQAALGGYRRVAERLGEPAVETIEAAQDRVWRKLTVPELIIEERNFKPQRRYIGRSWSRTITLPLPAAAAAAAVLVIVVCFAFVGIRGGTSSVAPDPATIANIGLDDQGIVPVNDMNGVLRYLSSQDNGDFMVVRLPERRQFSRTGEPALINAADYSRRRGPR